MVQKAEKGYIRSIYFDEDFTRIITPNQADFELDFYFHEGQQKPYRIILKSLKESVKIFNKTTVIVESGIINHYLDITRLNDKEFETKKMDALKQKDIVPLKRFMVESIRFL